ncbi:MAG: hypothetical protein A2X36_06770 [Elusimicrobia bacterium GWA2_69_24]|nr:MAG: hypothetical protein A2X36_06770 [Elusimicrobia bacterium GWA2_69_24]HBL17187.1 hypothetical protein [Elusimicrobiota bacterium]
MKKIPAVAALSALLLQPLAGWSFEARRAIDLETYSRISNWPGSGLLLAQAPSASAAAGDQLSLDELGLVGKPAAADPALQALLERRTRMLQRHQRLGLAAAVPLLAALLTGNSAKSSPSGRGLHAGLGSAATVLYLATAYHSIRAPNIPGAGPKKGATRIHRALAFVHYPAMLLTTAAGFSAKRQVERGRDAHSLGKQHPTIATTAAVSFLLAMGVMVINF